MATMFLTTSSGLLKTGLLMYWLCIRNRAKGLSFIDSILVILQIYQALMTKACQHEKFVISKLKTLTHRI
jgi:hypothetical protein